MKHSSCDIVTILPIVSFPLGTLKKHLVCSFFTFSNAKWLLDFAWFVLLHVASILFLEVVGEMSSKLTGDDISKVMSMQ